MKTTTTTKDDDEEGGGEGMQIVVPIVSVPRAEVSLRWDVVVLLNLAGIAIEDLVCVDDDVASRLLSSPPPMTKTSSAIRTSNTTTTAAISAIPLLLTLVDHNRIRSSYDHLSSFVIEILDHHVDELYRADDVTVDSGMRNVAYENGNALVASTCTLVVERMLRDMSRMSSSSSSSSPPAYHSIDPGLCLLLLGVILLDTVNMNPNAGKGTARDERAMRALMQYADWKSFDDDVGGIRRATSSLVDYASTFERVFPNGRGSPPDASALYDALSSAKFDPRYWSTLSVSDCLRIDYKRFEVSSNSSSSSSSLVSAIGISSVLVGMDTMLAREDFIRDLSTYVTSSLSSSDLYGMMTLTFREGDGGSPVRGLLLAGADASIVNSFADFLVNSADAAFLDMCEVEFGDEEGGRVPLGTSAGSGGDVEDANAGIAIRVFRQGNGKGSRKQVAPVLLRHAARDSRL